MLALQLDDATPGRVLDRCTIAVPQLFEMPCDFLEVQVVWQALYNRDTLPGGTLLELDGHHLLLSLLLLFVGIGTAGNNIELIFDFLSQYDIVVSVHFFYL